MIRYEQWDGVRRLANLQRDVLGVRDASPAEAAALGAWFVAAAYGKNGPRANPSEAGALGVNGNYLRNPVLCGGQGIGKSSFWIIIGATHMDERSTTIDSRTLRAGDILIRVNKLDMQRLSRSVAQLWAEAFAMGSRS